MAAESLASGVARVSLDEPLRPLALEGSGRVLLVVTAGGAVVGEALVASDGVVSVEAQREAIFRACGERLGARELRAAFLRAVRGPDPETPELTASAIVAPASGGGDLRRCLESLAGLRPAALDVLVLVRRDSGAARDTCAAFGAEPVEARGGEHGGLDSALARARGEVIALTDDACRFDAAWLAGLGVPFADPLVIAVTGYVGPLELRTGTQWRAYRRARPGTLDPATYDCFSRERPVLPASHLLLRRDLLEVSGLLAGRGGGTRTVERGGRGLARMLMAAGYRVAFDPARIVWRRPPRLSELARSGPAHALTGPRRRAAARQGRRLGLPYPQGGERRTQARVTAAGHAPLSVTVVSYNRRERLAQVLEALGAQTYPADRFETVIVLDGSTDGSAERARGMELPYSLRVIEQDNRGPAAARNRAVSEASAPIVVTLDDDIVPEPAFVAAHAEAHRQAGENHVVLGHCPQATPVRDLASLSGWHWYADFYRRRAEPNHVWSYADFGEGNTSLPRDLVLAVGGWDERFRDNQDWEVALRLLERGARFRDCPEAVGLHHVEVGLPSVLRKERVHGRADVALARKHPRLLSHLHLANLADAWAGHRLWSHLLPAVYRRPRAAARLTRPGLRLAAGFERAGRPDLWARTLGNLLMHAYVLGVRDSVPTLAELEELLAPIRRRDGLDRVDVHLDRTGSLRVPADAGQVELVLTYAAQEIARVDAPPPRHPWDWERVTDRVVDRAGEPFRRALARRPDALTGLAPGVRDVVTADDGSWPAAA